MNPGSHGIRRCSGLAIFVFATTAFAPANARAQSACRATYQQAAAEETAGHLRQARDSFASCMKASCTAPVHRECLSAFTRLDREDIPSVVVRGLDAQGKPLSDVEVTVDGSVVADHLDGRSIELDPGLHQFSFRAGSETLGTQKVLLAQGDRNHVISVELPAGESSAEKGTPVAPTPVASVSAQSIPGPAASPNPAGQNARSSFAFVLGAAGVLGCTAGAAAASFSKQDDRTSVAVDISIGAGVAALVIIGWFIANAGSPSRTGSARATVLAEGAGFPGLSGSF
jgi:hypothetical protein